nr:ATP-dependent RNA helicase DEAH11, chloroplastic-like [Tanacetum cinerariifolium]
MKKVVEKFGPDLHGLKERFPGSDFSLNTRYHTISICGSKEVKQNVEEIVQEVVGKTRSCIIPSEKTCTRCHLENHPFLSCEMYEEFKRDPDLSLKEWMKDKDVKHCPVCRFTIEKIDGCNHIECRCGLVHYRSGGLGINPDMYKCGKIQLSLPKSSGGHWPET